MSETVLDFSYPTWEEAIERYLAQNQFLFLLDLAANAPYPATVQ